LERPTELFKRPKGLLVDLADLYPLGEPVSCFQLLSCSEEKICTAQEKVCWSWEKICCPPK
jgi:hypothetical protein